MTIFNGYFNICFENYVKENLRVTALLLQNQYSLLETILSKTLCDTIEHVNINKLSVREFAKHSTSCKRKKYV